MSSTSGGDVITLPNRKTKCLDGSNICNDELLISILRKVESGKRGSQDNKTKNNSLENHNSDINGYGGNNSRSKVKSSDGGTCIPCELLKDKIINVDGGHDDPNHIPSDIKGAPNVVFTPVQNDNPEAVKALDILTEEFKCPKGDESCVITRAGKEGLIDKKNKHEAIAVIKQEGPLNGEWLSDADIWKLMVGWSVLHKNFYPINYAMLDFMKYPDVYELATFNPVKILEQGKDCFGCICNTDVHVGKGIHWVAIFGDMRGDTEWSVEFFNSTGKKYESFIKFTEKAAKQLQDYKPNITVKAVIATDKEHQKSDSECGLYSLYYIYSRLVLKTPYTKFNEITVSDINMFTFRKSLFLNGVENGVEGSKKISI